MLLLNRQHTHGITLLELVIVILIIGIVAAVAYPSYIDTVRKGRRADAVTSLLKLQIDQEQWRANHSGYTSQVAGDGCGSAQATGLCWASDEIVRRYYHIAINEGSVNSTGFMATATARAGTDQINDQCQIIVITQDGPDLDASSYPFCWSH